MHDSIGSTDSGTVHITIVNTPNRSFVTAAYHDFLKRAPTSSELSTTSAKLDAATTTRSQVLKALANSDEWLTTIVNQLYSNTLGRQGDPGGIAYWVNQLRTGAQSVAEVAAHFYASPEYYNGIGGGTDTSWLTDLYHKLLGRNPDAGGLSYWKTQTTQTGRVSVALRFYNSSESAHDRVKALYVKLLGRQPDTAGADYWAGQVVIHGDISLAQNLSASNEYFNRAHTQYP